MTRPRGWDLPTLAELEEAMPGLIRACADRFAGQGGVTHVAYRA